MAFGAADIPALLADLGVDVMVGGTMVKGLVDRPGQELLESEGAAALISTAILVTVQTGALPALAAGAAITVDGVSYLVQRRLEIDDGQLTQVLCVEAA
ncbi:MAG TPA: hypothetical protein VI700_05810 [Thermoanaerobaculaceae bacterium]|nr:hypothetical protein [Thermoanaerobaculaceae bacterium]